MFDPAAWAADLRKYVRRYPGTWAADLQKHVRRYLAGRSSRSVLALDFSAGAVQAVKLHVNSTAPRMSAAASLDEADGPLAEQIKEFAASGDPAAEIVVGIPRHVAAVRRLNLPSTDTAELSSMVLFEADRCLPFPAEQVEMDFVILRSGDSSSQVMLVAVQKDVVEQYVALLHEAGLAPDRITVAALGLHRAARSSLPEDEAVALVDVGAQTAEISIVRGGLVLFTRSAPVGLEVLVDEIQKGLGGDRSEAVECAMGVGMTVDEGRGGRVAEAVRAWADRLATEIDRSEAAFKTEPGGESIGSVVFCGRGGDVPGLAEYMSSRLAARLLTPPLPAAALGEDGETGPQAPSAMRALGLALLQIDGPDEGVNLLPEHVRAERAAGLRRRITIRVGTAAAAVVLVGLLVALRILAVDGREVEKLRLRVNALQAGGVAAMQEQIRQIEQFGWRGPTSLDVMWLLSTAKPEKLYMTNVNYRKGETLELRGRADSSAEVQKLLNALQRRRDFFSSVEQKYVNRVANQVEFSLSCQLTKGSR